MDYNSNLMVSLLTLFHRIDPYLPIVFLLFSLLIVYKFFKNLRIITRRIHNVRVDDILYKPLKEALMRHLKVERLVIRFVLLILSIEIAINVTGSAGWLAVNRAGYRPSEINISENCHIHYSKNLVVLTRFNSWSLYLLTRIVEIISQSLLPTICCALDVIRSAILSHSYRNSLRKWIIYISAKSIILLVLSNTFYTYVFFAIIQVFLFWLDLLMYCIYARRLHRFLKWREGEALIHLKSRSSAATLEYKKFKNSAKYFKVSSWFTFILELVLILQVTINSLFFIIGTELVNSCYFSYITFDYLESVQFGREIIHFYVKVKYYFYTLALTLSYVHQILMWIAYLLLLCPLSRFFAMRKSNHQLLRQNIKRMINHVYSLA